MYKQIVLKTSRVGETTYQKLIDINLQNTSLIPVVGKTRRTGMPVLPLPSEPVSLSWSAFSVDTGVLVLGLSERIRSPLRQTHQANSDYTLPNSRRDV